MTDYKSYEKCNTIREWVREQIMSGNLVLGQPAPTKNELAIQFGINKREIDTNLVYDLLIKQGLIALKDVKGQGTQRVVIYKNMKHVLIYQKCKKKTRYGSEKWAKHIANKCATERNIELNTYHCGLCDGWHISRKIYDQSIHENIL